MPMTPPSANAPLSPGEDADARAFEAFARQQDPLDVEAATWVARQRDGLDAAGQAQLRAWLEADAAHAAAFEDLDAAFGRIRRMRGAAAQPATHSATHSAETPSPPQRRLAVPARRQWLLGLGRPLPQAAAAALVLAVVGGGRIGWEHWRQGPTFVQAYATGRGQQLAVRLPDGDPSGAGAGSTLQLDTATQLEARLYRDRRELRLQDGQAMFTVLADAQRPFHVWVGPLRVTVVGTRFSVRHTASGLDAGQTVVSVEEGRVRVARAAEAGDGTRPAAQPVDLRAGQMVVADADGRIGLPVEVPPAAIAPWRDGRISFDRTPLAQALAEFERYGQTGLVVRDPAVAALPVGGSYGLDQLQRFAEALPQVLPVRLVRRGELTEVVAARPGNDN